MKGYVNKLESFGCVDGPGSRYIVFLSGCNFRCLYCHNPDTWNLKDGKEYDAVELVNQIESYRSYWGKKGGVTVSGGEPLLQIDFLIEFFTECKKRNINTCIDTAGGPFTDQGPWFEKFKKLMDVTDILLMDIKHINEEEHIKLTGHTRKNVEKMFRYLDEINKPIWIRHVLVPGYTDNDQYLIQTRDFIRSLHNVERVEVLPYHSLGMIKYKELGIEYPLSETKSPDPERVKKAREILECEKYDAWEK